MCTEIKPADSVNTRMTTRPLIKIALGLSIAFFIGCSSAPPKQQPVKVDTTTPSVAAPTGLSGLDQSLYQQAIDQLSAGEPKSAVKSLRTLERKYPRNAGIKVNLASAYFTLNDIAAAKSAAEVASRLDSELPHAQNLLGLIHVEEKKFKDAEAFYSKALKLDKDYATAHYNIALLYDIYYQDIAKAYEHYNKYLAIVGDDQETKDWVEQLKYSLD